MDTPNVMDGCSMSASEKKQRRQRRSFSPEFKAGAVKLALVEGKSVAEVAKERPGPAREHAAALRRR
ncbi:transposase [Myxococcus xanthus]|uniref:Transposase n=2 Tax=Myxococcus xanthus TaxID=34 RepID=A0A7Y4MR61_MYXXA|nr:transposase [Myxococcus xanthus]NOJ86569.1 transposase [Myxococcus xanthus]